MSDSKGLKIRPPEKLPAEGITKISFKVFWNQLRAYLEQDQSNYLFLPDGCYSEWLPGQHNAKRIASLADDDRENKKLIQAAAQPQRDQRVDLEDAQESLLLKRNSQLSKFLTLIAVLCHYTEQDDIMQCATSMEWIQKYLQQHYNLECRGEHFLDVLNVVYKSETPYQTFYKQFRAGFLDNLRKRGDRLAYRNDELLTEDENMSPTLEASIVLWALEKIDPRLPKKIKKNYGHQMVGNTCIVALQPTIFQNIGTMINELDEGDYSSRAQACVTEVECNWMQTRKGFPRQARAISGRGRNASARIRGGSTRGNAMGARKPFCRICYHSGSSQSVYQSHPISSCSWLTPADRADLRAAEQVTEDCHLGAARLEAYEAPGWDADDDAADDKMYILNDNDNIYTEFYDDNFMDNSQQALGQLKPMLSPIIPVPSQRLDTIYLGQVVPITLDSGATISFIRLS